MRSIEYARAALHALTSRPLRTVLTLLGIIVGSGSIVLISGLLSSGGDQMVRANQEANEADLVPVRAAPPARAQGLRTQRPLARADADELRLLPALRATAVASEAAQPETARWRHKSKQVTVVGGEPAALRLYRLALQQGRFLIDADLASRRRVCVVGDEVWRELLDATPPSAASVDLQLGGQTWSVVGVLAHKPTMATVGGDTNVWNRKVVVPATTFDAVFSPRHEASRLYVRVGRVATLASDIALAERIVRGLLLRRHLGVENFKVGLHGGAAAKQALLIAMIIRVLVVGTGLLSLFVGGINVMNIMLVTVSERTREIGLRRALGATPRQVLALFLLESALLATVGGVIGVGGAIALSWLIALIMSAAIGAWSMHVVGWAVAAGLTLSSLTGVLFGVLPASRAARLDPVEALRQE